MNITSVGTARDDVLPTPSATRVTPDASAAFRDIVGRGSQAIVQGAEAAVSALPGAPIVAAAVRPSGTPGVASPTGSAALGTPNSYSLGTAESPNGAASGAPIESTLAQSKDQNLYYLQLQEQLAAENRSYTAMSNVLKARHDTVKNAIGNIR